MIFVKCICVFYMSNSYCYIPNKHLLFKTHLEIFENCCFEKAVDNMSSHGLLLWDGRFDNIYKNYMYFLESKIPILAILVYKYSYKYNVNYCIIFKWENWKYPKCLSISFFISKLWNIYRGEVKTTGFGVRDSVWILALPSCGNLIKILHLHNSIFFTCKIEKII